MFGKGFDQFQIGGGRDVVDPAHVTTKLVPRFTHAAMDVGAGRNDFVQHKFIHFHLMQKSFSHRVQCIGWPTKKPIDGGLQHTQDFTESLKHMLIDTEIVELTEPNQIFQAFKDAYNRDGSTVVVEWGDFYADK